MKKTSVRLAVAILVAALCLGGCNGGAATSSSSSSPTPVPSPPSDTTAPTIPSNLTASAVSSSQINLTWTASTDNVGITGYPGYRVYRGGAQVATTSGTAYSDNGLSASTTYSYQVAAYDAAGNVSAQSTQASATTPGRADVVGGLLETAATATVRPRLTSSQLQSFLPTRGKFTFPAPYNTQGVRITNASDCSGNDCLWYVGYSYWRNMNNHVGSDTMYIFLGLNRNLGGSGPTLFSYNKVTDEVQNLGPLFDAGSALSWSSGEGWYFSATQPTKIYLNNGPKMQRYDVVSKQFETVYDVTTQFGSGVDIWQMHSSDDDKVHSATLRSTGTWQYLGCVIYHEDTAQFQYFPKIGDFDECNLDRSGRWLISLENTQGPSYGLDMRVFDLGNGTERIVLDQNGAVGHADMGYGYVVGSDNWNSMPNAILGWNFFGNPLAGTRVFYNNDWSVPAANHISHTNARPGVPMNQQYACGSNASTVNSAWGNEVICFGLNSSFNVLVVAPVMTDMNAASGGDSYNKEPKGNLDVTGQYFIWTSNTGGNRVDAFIVKVPAQLLTATFGTGSP